MSWQTLGSRMSNERSVPDLSSGTEEEAPPVAQEAEAEAEAEASSGVRALQGSPSPLTSQSLVGVRVRRAVPRLRLLLMNAWPRSGKPTPGVGVGAGRALRTDPPPGPGPGPNESGACSYSGQKRKRTHACA